MDEPVLKQLGSLAGRHVGKVGPHVPTRRVPCFSLLLDDGIPATLQCGLLWTLCILQYLVWGKQKPCGAEGRGPKEAVQWGGRGVTEAVCAWVGSD